MFQFNQVVREVENAIQCEQVQSNAHWQEQPTRRILDGYHDYLLD